MTFSLLLDLTLCSLPHKRLLGEGLNPSGQYFWKKKRDTLFVRFLFPVQHQLQNFLWSFREKALSSSATFTACLYGVSYFSLRQRCLDRANTLMTFLKCQPLELCHFFLPLDAQWKVATWNHFLWKTFTLHWRSSWDMSFQPSLSTPLPPVCRRLVVWTQKTNKASNKSAFAVISSVKGLTFELLSYVSKGHATCLKTREVGKFYHILFHFLIWECDDQDYFWLLNNCVEPRPESTDEYKHRT